MSFSPGRGSFMFATGFLFSSIDSGIVHVQDGLVGMSIAGTTCALYQRLTVSTILG